MSQALPLGQVDEEGLDAGGFGAAGQLVPIYFQIEGQGLQLFEVEVTGDLVAEVGQYVGVLVSHKLDHTPFAIVCANAIGNAEKTGHLVHYV